MISSYNVGDFKGGIANIYLLINDWKPESLTYCGSSRVLQQILILLAHDLQHMATRIISGELRKEQEQGLILLPRVRNAPEDIHLAVTAVQILATWS